MATIRTTSFFNINIASFPRQQQPGGLHNSYICEYLYVICTNFGVLVVNKPSILNEITDHKKSKRVKMDTASSTYASVNIYQTTRHHTPADGNLRWGYVKPEEWWANLALQGKKKQKNGDNCVMHIIWICTLLTLLEGCNDRPCNAHGRGRNPFRMSLKIANEEVQLE
jgi:hypothetical protein